MYLLWELRLARSKGKIQKAVLDQCKSVQLHLNLTTTLHPELYELLQKTGVNVLGTFRRPGHTCYSKLGGWEESVSVVGLLLLAAEGGACFPQSVDL